MIFIYNAKGDLIKRISENVYQGSNNVNEIYFIAPIKGVAVQVGFTLPNGQTSQPRQMVEAASPLEDVKDKFGNLYSVYSCKIDSFITAYSGNVQMQFFILGINDETLASYTTEFNVGKGVVKVLPDQPDDIFWEQIRTYLVDIANNESTLSNEINNLKTADTNLLLQIGGKVNKLTGNYELDRVYSVKGTGEDKFDFIDYYTTAHENAIPKRNLTKNIYLPNPPEEKTDSANKDYVDTEIARVKSIASAAFRYMGATDKNILLNVPTKDSVGNIYNITTSFYSNENFADWSGVAVEYPAYTNVIVVIDEITSKISYEVMAQIVDLVPIQNAIDKKVDKITINDSVPAVHAINTDNTPTTARLDFMDTATYNAIPRRNESLNIYLPNEPQQDTDSVNKKYVDDELANKLDKPTKIDSNNDVVLVALDGSTSVRSLSLSPTQGKIPTYGGANNSGITDGTGYLSTGTPVQNYHAANKKYVDDQIANAGGGKTYYKHYASISKGNLYIGIEFISSSNTPISTVTDFCLNCNGSTFVRGSTRDDDLIDYSIIYADASGETFINYVFINQFSGEYGGFSYYTDISGASVNDYVTEL